MRDLLILLTIIGGIELISQKSKEKILVIGAGVSGLTTALCLAREGFEVTVVAEKFAPDITSVVAGALWEWPPAVCGYHSDERSLKRSKEWCQLSYNIFSELAENHETGVYMRTANFYFKDKVEDNIRHSFKMKELKNHVEDFRHDPALITENKISEKMNLKDAYSHLAPMIDTDVYMSWLLKEINKAGCHIIHRRISGNIIEQEEALKKEFQADVIVNCAGLGSIELTGDDMYPLRGALVRVRNNGVSFPKVTQAHCVSYNDAKAEQDMIFIVPRGENILLLGGLVESDEWSLNIGLDNYEPIRDMFDRCKEFMPFLKDAELDLSEPVRVGLRPSRKQNVRLEQEANSRIIHNYGHGGSGITFSWGCASEVTKRIYTMLSYELAQ
jgi:D-amino-acid oxidase